MRKIITLFTALSMIAALIAVPVSATGVETVQSFVDNCADLGNVYSSANFVAAVTSELVSGYDDATILRLKDKTKEAELVYKAADGESFSTIRVAFSRQNPIKFPVIAYSMDGVDYEDLTEPMTTPAYNEGGKYWTNDGTVNGTYHIVFSRKQILPRGTKFVKIRLQTSSIDKTDCLYFREISLEIEQKYDKSLAKEYKPYFDISAAVERLHLYDCTSLLRTQTNVLVTENSLKSWIHKYDAQTKEHSWYWKGADEIVDFAKKNNMKVRAHTLVCPDFIASYAEDGDKSNAWFYADDEGVSLFNDDGTVKDQENARELTLSRLENHIKTIIGRYKDSGVVYAYDVVNEAFSTGNNTRNYTKLWKLLGQDDITWIEKCFEWAHEADPNAVLIYNDNGFTSDLIKQQTIYDLIKGMRDKGLPVDVGMQMHYLGDVSLKDVDNLLNKFSEICDIYITELEISMKSYNTLTGETSTTNGVERAVLESVAYPNYMLEEIEALQAKKYGSLFDIFRKYDKIKCVGFWGVYDGQNEKYKKEIPLLFDHKQREKDAYYAVTDFEKNLPRWHESYKMPRLKRIDYEVNEQACRVDVKVNTDSAKSVKVSLYKPADSGANPLGNLSLIQEETKTVDGEGLFSFDLSSDTKLYTLVRTIDGITVKDYFYYNPIVGNYTIEDDFNDFEKMYSFNQVALKSNLTVLGGDMLSITPNANARTDRFIVYKLPDNYTATNITLNAVFHEGYISDGKHRQYPKLYGSTDGKTYAEITGLYWWKLSSGDYIQYKGTASAKGDNFRYIKILFGGEIDESWQVSLTKLKIESTPVGVTLVNTPKLYGKVNSVWQPQNDVTSGEMKTEVSLTNNSQSPQSIRVCTAVKSNNALTEIYVTEKKQLTVGENFVFKGFVSAQSGDSIEIFVFDCTQNDNSINPLMDKTVFK